MERALSATTQPALLAYTCLDISVAEQDLDIELWPSTVQEVKDAIKNMKNCNALGHDNVHAEKLKAEKDETPQLLQHILQDFWISEVKPDA